MPQQDNMTLVSGYWSVTGRYTDEMYHTWFKKTMKINQRMYFFCERETIPLIQAYRGDLETIFVECTIDDFYSNTRYNPDWVNVYDIPSVELGKIYHEKINLMKRAKDMDGENATDFYVWYDAGNFLFRKELPPTQRLNLSSPSILCPNMVSYSTTYPPDETMVVAGSAYIIHKTLVDDIHTMFYNLVKKHIEDSDVWQYGSDEFIFTKLLSKYPQAFIKIAQGRGENLMQIYKL